jgi:tetratricopeptide (TPR) repeat protein
VRLAAAEARAAERTALLRRRAEADYEVALFERSAWAAIALDEIDSTEVDLAPAIAASDDFLARFPASAFVPACRFNRADLEARLALARARARHKAPDFGPAIVRYEQLLAAHPAFRRADAALFNIASLERARGNDAAADRRLAELIARAPDSELASEAHVALGDRAFDAQDFAAAERHFAAAATRTPAYAPMARYKQGHAALRRRDAPTAIDAFAALLALPGVDSSSAGDGLVQLARAIRLGGGAPTLARFLDAHREAPYGFELVRLVAAQEGEDGSFDRAAQAWRLGLERWPQRPEALDFAQNTLAAWDARAREEERIQARLDLARHFAPGAPGAASGPPGAAFGARALLEAAFLVHEKAKAKGDRVQLARAVELYRERERLYPAADSAALAATSEGEALFDLGRFAEAARAHDRAAARLPSTGSALSAADTLRRESAFGAALARERVATAGGYKGASERDSLERAIERLEAAAPGDPRIPPLRLSLALGARDAADEPRARRLFERMAGRDTSEASRRSQAELGRIALAEKRWLDAEKSYAGAAAAYLAAGDRAEEARLVELAASARFKEAEDLEAHGDSAKAADDFRALADQYPNFPRADVALYRAGLAHLAAGVPRRAEEHLATLRERYPKSALADDALLRRAEAQIAARDTAGAAATYAGAPLTTANFVAGHEEAARLWRGMGAFTDAEAAYRRIAREAPDPRARTRALADLATLLYELERKPEAFQVTAPWRAGRLPEGFAPDPRADESGRFVAGRLLADSTLALPVTHPIKPALDRKLAVLGPALDHLKAAATTTASPWWGESGFVAGLLLDDLGTRVAALPPPSKMSAEDSLGYRNALAAQANSFYARAEDLWIATLEGLGDLAPKADSARADTSRPRTGWAGRIWERLEPRLVAHYRWRMAADDLPPDDGGVSGLSGANGSTLVAGLGDEVAAIPTPSPAAPGDSLDAGAREDLRNRLRWIAQYVADGQVEEAGRWTDTALKSFPNRAEIWNDAGVVRHRLGDWAGADRAWSEALRLDPRHPAALYNRAVFERFYRLDRAAARRAFERFLTLGAPFDEALADRMAEDRK